MKIIIDLSGIKEYVRYLTIVIPIFMWLYGNYKLYKGELDLQIEPIIMFVNIVVIIVISSVVIIFAWS